ncbi:hypothetical protein VOLCADRAFT_89696 [Volvox carteri f. nagariensis]|uniref:GCVT N-terminal domain-containing protein n=1 Tax=Volvox carteri f. nagariensis TaxID=3068 RepID=D8TRU7_VOLCA|nr:uncharacterized protein VOLCADRAFT_89696 [Volvox carteri f. nagariensis]EFJ49830.1 hypothetical protein VOLCADRAFT_89696 [Volvox carteri f. nagariensis]|eukprot:XP_002949337.1 hypothetical protein VOLCADRAFT_89696 [Volvox carteri f. nagariensis]
MYGSRVRTATAVVPAAAAAGGSGGGSGAAMSLGDLQLDIPEIDGDIRSLQVEMGAIFNDSGLAATFGRKRQALQALETGLVLVDQSHWGRLRVTGEDRTALLHNQSTADFQRLQPGQCADTTFVTSTARCLDLATALVLPSSILLLVDSREGGEALAARLDKVIFRGDNVMVHDISSRTGQIAVLGPEAEVVLRELAPDVLSGVLSGPPGRHVLVGFRGKPVFVAAVSGLGLSVPGYTLVADEAVAGDLYAAFAAKGAIPMGTDDWEAARIVAGRPTRGSELTEAYSPLEAGLYGAVSLNKGCYIGQETLAKLHLRDGVNRQLWGLRLSGPTSPGAEIYSELSKVGVVTSTCQDADGEWVGVGYLRSRLEGTQIELEGVRVAVAGAPATVTAIPFATRKFSAEAESPAVRAAAVVAATGEEDAASIAARLEEAKRKKAEVQVEKQAATEAKLKAMQERVAAWQAALQQQQQGQQQ